METGSTLYLPEEISIANVAEWKNKLIDFIREPAPLILDAENLSRVDTAALQLMTAFTHKAQAENKAVSWKNPTATLLKTAEQLGLEQALSLK